VNIGPANSSQLVDDIGGEPTAPFDSLDPQYGFFVVDGYFANVFQGLVQFNGSDSQHVVPSLASNYTVAANFENYTFTMRPNTWFSNKDPINAYVAWFSFVRINYMNAPTTVGYSNYVNLLYNSSAAPDKAGNVWPWGLQNAINSVYHIPATDESKQVSALNYILSHFDTTNSSIQMLMSYPHQALVASNASKFQINLIQPYKLFLLALPPQWGAMVDPVYIDPTEGSPTTLWCRPSTRRACLVRDHTRTAPWGPATVSSF
jgi:peptide/nickel transport system substrate-binding protein